MLNNSFEEKNFSANQNHFTYFAEYLINIKIYIFNIYNVKINYFNLFVLKSLKSKIPEITLFVRKDRITKYRETLL